MEKFQVFAIIALLTSIILFLPDFVPCCSICKKKKLRFLFILHFGKIVQLSHRGTISVCRACALKYRIRSKADFEAWKKADLTVRTGLL